MGRPHAVARTVCRMGWMLVVRDTGCRRAHIWPG